MWGAIAGALGGIASAFSARQQQQAQQQLQTNNQDWQERMSNTAHQREVADLKAAGLNPVLSAGGQGASTPSGGVGEAQMADIGNSINTAIQAKIANAQTKNLNAQTEKAQADAEKTKIETDLAPKVANADILLKGANAGSARAQEAYTQVMKNIDKELKTEEKELKKAQTKKTDKETPYGGKTINTAKQIMSIFK